MEKNSNYPKKSLWKFVDEGHVLPSSPSPPQLPNKATWQVEIFLGFILTQQFLDCLQGTLVGHETGFRISKAQTYPLHHGGLSVCFKVFKFSCVGYKDFASDA